MQITPVGVLYTPYTTKFGIPRQSGLADTESRLVLEPAYRSPEAIRGIEGFSHLWLIWQFTEARREGNPLTVRPPRLGGNTRVGVFASRSPFRPNGLGLSCVRLIRVDTDDPCGPVLVVGGADLLNGTPIYDIKPYLPFADCVPGAVGGYTEETARQCLEVRFTADASLLPEKTRRAVEQLLRDDPRPHYQDDPARVYAFEFDGWHVEFTVSEGVAEGTGLAKA